MTINTYLFYLHNFFFHVFINIVTPCNAEDQNAPDKWSVGGAVPGLWGCAAEQPVF